MRRLVLWIVGVMVLVAAFALPAAAASKRVLIVMDEREQMEALAKYLKAKGGVESTIVDQKALPEDWSGFDAVVGYIHGALQEPTELKIIEYTKNGGRYICLHHSISSGKAKNKHYFDFLGVRLTGTDKAREPSQPGDHYAWREGVDITVVKLNPTHYITTTNVTWPEKTMFRLEGDAAERERPSLTLKHAEAYMNHGFTDGNEKIILLGLKYLDDRNGALYMQPHEGWLKPSGKGWIVYLQPGHSTHEFEQPAVAQMILNAITWTPSAAAR